MKDKIAFNEIGFVTVFLISSSEIALSCSSFLIQAIESSFIVCGPTPLISIGEDVLVSTNTLSLTIPPVESLFIIAYCSGVSILLFIIN